MYQVQFTSTVLKSLQKMDKQIAKMIIAWIEKNLEGCDNPRLHGKGLKGDRKDVWRYRIGNYRLLANINDKAITILLVDVGHRKNVYK
jgi:mRNA interferase RelE/StbE